MTVVSNNVMIVESLGTKTSFTEVTGAHKFNIPQGMMLVEGVMGVANTKNRNNRYYTLEEYKRHINTFMQRVNEENGVFGEMEHPKSMNIDLNNVSHKIMDVRIDESTGEVLGTLLLLDTPKGMIAQSVVRSGSPLPVSSRALGAVNPKTGETVLEFLSTWDLVGTSGFKQATVRQISESVEENGMVVESLEFALNSDQQISESVQSELHSTEIKEIVENYLAARVNTNVNENDNDDEVLETKMHELFVTQYAPVIEQWINSTYTNKLTAGIQSWLVESFAPQLQSWIVESYTPEIANSIQSWVTESVAPEIGNAVQTWIAEDYSTQVQSWVTEEFAPVVESWVTEEFAPAYGDVVENWLMADALPQLQVVENANAVASTATIANEGNTVTIQATQPTQAQIFKSAILETLDAKINDAKAIEKPVAVVERVDEAMFKTGPAWLTRIPSQFKASWTALNESQREKVYRKASIRTFETLNDIETFWNGIDFQTLVESQVNSTVLNRTINENVQPSFKANAGVFAAAKALSGRK